MLCTVVVVVVIVFVQIFYWLLSFSFWPVHFDGNPSFFVLKTNLTLSDDFLQEIRASCAGCVGTTKPQSHNAFLFQFLFQVWIVELNGTSYKRLLERNNILYWLVQEVTYSTNMGSEWIGLNKNWIWHMDLYRFILVYIYNAIKWSTLRIEQCRPHNTPPDLNMYIH